MTKQIPEGWHSITLKDVYDFKNGLNKEKSAFGSGTPIVNYMDVYKNHELKISKLKGLVTLNKNELSNFEVKRGDVFFTRTSETIDEIGLTAVMNDDCENVVFSGFLLRARPKNNLITTNYAKYCFLSPMVRDEIKQKSSCTTRALTSGKMLGDVEVILPKNPEEQDKIVEVLDAWAKAVDLQEQKVEKLKEKKKALMQKLLTPKTDWLKLPLKEIMDFYNGYTFKSETYCDGCDGKYKVITIANVKNGEMVIDKNTSTIDELPENIRDFQILSKGDILISMTGNVGRVCKVDEDDCLLNQRVGKIVVKKNFSSDFVYYALQTYDFIEKMMIFAQGAAQDNMSVKDVNRYKCWIPKEIAEQEKIANILLSLDKKIILNKNLLNQYYQQQKAIMQKLLTGEIRVNG